MSSYAARASRRTQTGAAESKAVPQTTAASLSRPQLHSRKHSANSAGDVFAMLGQPMGSKVSGTRDKDRQATIHEPCITEEPPNGEKGLLMGESTDDSPSSASTSSPSTPTSSLPAAGDTSGKSVHGHGTPSSKRYKRLYSKPTLLKLWKSQLSVNAAFDELYSAFETPEQQQLQLESVPQHKYQNIRSHTTVEGDRSANHDRSLRRERDPLGRLPPVGNTSASSGLASSPGLALPPNNRRTSPASGNFGPGSLAGVFQGGVLSGVAGPSVKKAENGPSAPVDSQRAPSSARSKLFNERDKPSGSAANTPPWSSNRWRHLQADEDSHISSSGSSTKDETEDNDAWAKAVATSESQWRPGQHDAIEREKQALLRGQASQASAPRSNQDVLSQPSWRRRESPADSQIPGVHEVSQQATSTTSGGMKDGGGNRPQLTASASNQSLFLDDLLGPTRLQNQPVSVQSSRSNSIVTNLSAMQLGNEPALSQSNTASSRFGNSAHSTPTRASAAEGLEVLARRSPVQEMSMAALQQQRPLQTPSASAAHHFRPPSLPHPTAEPADRIFWQYRDPQGQLQGPFSVVQMQEWYSQGFFSDTLLVKRVESTDYETLGALIIRLRDVNLPFFSAPLVHHVYAAPPGMHAPGLGHPPFHRMASPTPWQQQEASLVPEQIQQPPLGQRNVSFTAGNAVYDLFSKAQQPASKSPESLVSSVPDAKQPEQVAEIKPSLAEPVHDPWADMTPTLVTGSSIPRGSSALGGDPIAVENAVLRQSAPGHHLSSIGVNALRQDSLPSPIGRSPSMVNSKEPVSKAVQPIDLSVKPDSAQSPPIGGPLSTSRPQNENSAQQSKATNSKSEPLASSNQRSALSTSNQAKSVAASTVDKPAPQPASIAAVQQTTAPKEAARESAVGKSDGVTVVSQEKFEKQKKTPAGVTHASEVPLSSLTPASSPPLDTPSSAARKVAPWAKPAEDKSTLGSANQAKPASGMSLREIQAKEQKEAEARRAQEKKLHAAQRSAEEAALAERRARETSEGLPLTARWGDSAASSPSVSNPPSAPWAKLLPTTTVAAKGGKKTLREIQEEEEARRRAAQQAQAQKVSKAYANTITNTASVPASDSPWQTVGAAKPATPSASVPSSVRAPVVNGASNGVAAHRPAVQSPYSMASKLSGQAPKSAISAAAPAAVRTISSASAAPASAISTAPSNRDEEPAFPASSDLLTWCKEALKGLDIPIDDFIQMLLSFPVPLDKSTRELISDSVYASSRTLDGRYFSDAFADKRLADTKAIKLGKSVPISLASFFGTSAHANSTSSTTGKSMADAIKFIPAQKGPELNFKVVTKSKGKKK